MREEEGTKIIFGIYFAPFHFLGFSEGNQNYIKIILKLIKYIISLYKFFIYLF